jgi:DNA-binding NarL/FixJ family response regulator
MTRVRVLLADDHETVRQGLRLLLETQPDLEVIGEAPDGAAAIQLATALRPDLIVMDVAMPRMNGLQTVRALGEVLPDLPVVALTRYRDDAYVNELLGSGAAAYVLKQSPSQELLKAIRAAVKGETYVDPSLDVRLPFLTADGRPRRVARLSRREAEVLRLMALGYSNKEIAGKLDLSVKTVEVHKANATRKLNLNGRIEVVRFAVLQGWLAEP